MKFHCILVIYNLQCNESPSFSYLATKQHYNNIRLIVCDNSTIAEIKKHNELFCKRLDLTYIDMNGNAGLSKAYNSALKTIEPGKWVVIFDQDTEISDEYFLRLEESINTYADISLHVPFIYSKTNKSRMSPRRSTNSITRKIIRRIFGKKGLIHSSGVYRDITAINTGMVINRDVFYKTGLYNEDLFLDYVDHFFIREYKKYFTGIAVFDCNLYQEYSRHNNNDSSADLKRFLHFKHDFYVFCKHNLLGRLLGSIVIICRSLELTYLYKDITFIKYLLCDEKEK